MFRPLAGDVAVRRPGLPYNPRMAINLETTPDEFDAAARQARNACGSGAAAVQQVSFGAADPWRLFLAPFQRAAFDIRRFADEDIVCPPDIARSVVKRQAEYFHGRLCARQALLALGIAGQAVATGAMREPVWPRGSAGSITHNGEYAAAVAVPAGACGGIGIDIESVTGGTSAEAIRSIAVGRHELALFGSVAGLTPTQCLTLAFSVKESFFKAAFRVVGRYFDFDAVSLTEIIPERRHIQLRVNQDLCAQFSVGGQVAAHFDFLDADTVITGIRW